MQEQCPPCPPCPSCGSEQTIPMAWGFPTPELMEASQRGEVILCGCLVPFTGDSIGPESAPPDTYCKDCQHKFRR